MKELLQNIALMILAMVTATALTIVLVPFLIVYGNSLILWLIL